ncbi:MAG: hypothetical protein JXA74_15795 [Anaerolineae bacterium]|jgi:hypothetical protein|nr:hypothetical protein [Anaerolineae bacterium]
MYDGIYPIETAVALRLEEAQRKAAHTRLVKEALQARDHAEGLLGWMQRAQDALDRVFGVGISANVRPYARLVR